MFSFSTMYSDSRSINKFNVKYWFLIPWFDEILDFMAITKCFFKIDLHSGFHKIRIMVDDEWNESPLKHWLDYMDSLVICPNFVCYICEVMKVLKAYIGKILIVILMTFWSTIKSTTLLEHMLSPWDPSD